jgi:hypothetical protein
MDPDDYRWPDDYYRGRFDMIFGMLSLFAMAAMSLAAAMARKSAAGSREQGGNAYQQDDVFHRFSLATNVPFAPG